MRMDVFIVSCISHFHRHLLLLLFPSFSPPMAHLSSSFCVLNLVNHLDVPALLFELVSFCLGECTCASTFRPFSTPHQPKPPIHLWSQLRFLLRRCNGVWNLGRRKKKPLHDSTLSEREPLAITLHLILLAVPSFFLFFSSLLSFASLV